MNRRDFVKSAALASGGLVLAGTAAAQAPAPAPLPASFGPQGAPFIARRAIALVGGTVIDATGAPPITGRTVVIEGNKITRIGRIADVAIPEGAEQIDCTGLTIMPGMIASNQSMQLNPLYPAPAADLPLDQIKARWEDNFSRIPYHAHVFLMQGLTSIRQTNGPVTRLLPIKKRIDAGELPGPRVMLGGGLFMSDRYFDFYIRSNQSPPEAIEWLRKDFAYNVITDVERDTAGFESDDFAFWKIYLNDEVYNGKNDFSDAELRRLIDRGHKLGKKIDCHAGPHNPGLKRMTGFDIDTLEHPFLNTAVIDRATIDAYARNKVIVASLLTIMVNQAALIADPHVLDEAAYFMSMRPDEYRLLMQYRDKMRFLRAHPSQGGLPLYQGRVKPGETARDTFGLKGPSLDELNRRAETARANMRQFIDAGVKMSMGTDTPTFLNFPQSDPAAAEFQGLIDGGLTPMQAVQAATRNGAEALGMLDRLGTIESGKLADVIALAGNPLTSAAALKRVAIVIKDGVRYK